MGGVTPDTYKKACCVPRYSVYNTRGGREGGSRRLSVHSAQIGLREGGKVQVAR